MEPLLPRAGCVDATAGQYVKAGHSAWHLSESHLKTKRPQNGQSCLIQPGEQNLVETNDMVFAEVFLPKHNFLPKLPRTHLSDLTSAFWTPNA